ncbi:MAG TPA: imidazole glycerol phosphate synthase subunit HisH [bacterium]|nr:imidazole glycerol phosphate synthase subunit HisH [bacterium]
MIAIVDYGMGNLRSVQKAFEKIGAKAVVTSDAGEVQQAEKVVLPGVGAFGACMENLEKLGLVPTIRRVIDDKKPFLGICMGLQVLFDEGEEFGKHKGLGIIPGKVIRFKLGKQFKIPHMGWNRIHKKRRHPVLAEIDENAYFYFVHSYHVVPKDPQVIATTTDYGKEFVSSIARDNIFACQFHPEKSQGLGLKMLKAFANL